MSNLFSIIGFILEFLAYLLILRYNLHMFQLNGYKNNEQISWLKKNWRNQSILLVLLFVGILAAVIDFWLTDVVLYVVLLLMLLFYRFLKKSKNKKKLVFTNRVKRLICTQTLLMIIGLALLCWCLSVDRAWHYFCVLLFLQPCLILFSNLLNKPIEKGVNQHFINDAKRKLKEVQDLKIIGITGSYGKTSVKYFLYTLLQSKYDVLITPESYNTPMGIVKTIRESLKPTHEYFICEMGARYVGDIKEICDIVHPMYGVITSIGPQHLQTFGSLDHIIKTKFELADALPKDGTIFLNGDDMNIRGKSNEYENPIFFQTGTDLKGYRAEDITYSQVGTEFTIVTPKGETQKFQMRLIGGHNVIDVTCAIAVANSLGISLPELKVPVRRLQPVEHRMQMRQSSAVTIIDDAYNSNPVGSKAAVETLAMFDGIKILVTPGMVELGAEEEKFNYEFGKYAANCCDYILLIGRKHTEAIAKGVMDEGFSKDKCQVFERLEDAMTYAYAIKGEGHKYILLENDLPDNY